MAATDYVFLLKTGFHFSTSLVLTLIAGAGGRKMISIEKEKWGVATGLLQATQAHNGRQEVITSLTGSNLYIPEHERIIADS